MSQTTLSDPVIQEHKELRCFFLSKTPTPKQAKALDACYQRIELDNEGWPAGLEPVSPLLLAVQLQSDAHIRLCLDIFRRQWRSAVLAKNERDQRFYEAQAQAIQELRPDLVLTSQESQQIAMPLTIGDYIYTKYPELANFFSQMPCQTNLLPLQTHYPIEWNATPINEYHHATMNIFIIALCLGKLQHAQFIAEQPNYQGLLLEPLTRHWIQHFTSQKMIQEIQSQLNNTSPSITSNRYAFELYRMTNSSGPMTIPPTNDPDQIIKLQ